MSLLNRMKIRLMPDKYKWLARTHFPYGTLVIKEPHVYPGEGLLKALRQSPSLSILLPGSQLNEGVTSPNQFLFVIEAWRIKGFHITSCNLEWHLFTTHKGKAKYIAFFLVEHNPEVNHRDLKIAEIHDLKDGVEFTCGGIHSARYDSSNSGSHPDVSVPRVNDSKGKSGSSDAEGEQVQNSNFLHNSPESDARHE
tara:strand:+ start:449 stop:1036 length:588 start_codon:yes stop_codon:yes gene_type:complete